MTGDVRSYWRNFIDGEWVDAVDGRRISIINRQPAKKSPRSLGAVQRTSNSQLRRHVDALKVVCCSI